MPDKETEKTEKTTVTQTEEKTKQPDPNREQKETSGGDPAHDPTQPGPQEK